MSGIVSASVSPWCALAALFVAAVATYAAIIVLRPLLLRIALARPNARSSHTQPTPQGGGIAVVGVTLAIMVLGLAMLGAQSGIAAPPRHCCWR
jgi:UDP-N-acetylmuramyl pentapeptide phosphotransferase/UDP-N-acetylglucosamine-1-phosphate transferase